MTASSSNYFKLSAAGNTLILLRGVDGDFSSEQIVHLLDRENGLDADNLFLYREAPVESEYDYLIDGYNRDGTRVGLCANGARAFTWYIDQHQGLKNDQSRYVLRIDKTRVVTSVPDSSRRQCLIELSKPRFDPKDIPATGIPSSGEFEINGRNFSYGLVNIGNPHCVLFVSEAPSLGMTEEIGVLLESDVVKFPERVNVEFCYLSDTLDRITMRIYERGVGITTSSGSGTIASALAAIKYKKAKSEIVVEMPGGTQKVYWKEGGTVTALVAVDEVSEGYLPNIA